MSSAATSPAIPPRAQCATAACLVRPAAFAYNTQTAASNRFQTPGKQAEADAAAALEEFDALVTALRGAGLAI